MVTMGMGNECPIHLPPRIDVKFTRGAIKACFFKS
jgi:hypothetical protein